MTNPNLPASTTNETPEQTESRFNSATVTPIEHTKSSVEEDTGRSLWQKVREALSRKALKGTAIVATGASVITGVGVVAHELSQPLAPETSLDQKDSTQDVLNNPNIPDFTKNINPVPSGEYTQSPAGPPEVYIPPVEADTYTISPQPKDPTADINMHPDLPEWVKVDKPAPSTPPDIESYTFGLESSYIDDGLQHEVPPASPPSRP